MLSFSDWWQTQVNPAWRNLMENSQQIDYFKKGYEAALTQMPTQSADELIEENEQLNNQLATTQEQLVNTQRQLRRVKDQVTKLSVLLADDEESDNDYLS